MSWIKCFGPTAPTIQSAKRKLGIALGVSLMLFTACTDNTDEDPKDIINAFLDGGLDALEPSCIPQEGDCPNVCVGGTGILGETCGGTQDCMCGLFCSASICVPYEGEFEGCTCLGEAPIYGEVRPDPGCEDAEDGTACDDENPCTVFDACSAGSCVGTAKDCSGLDVECQTVGVCDTNTGECEATAVEEGAICDDGDFCTDGDVCADGACVPGEPVPSCSCAGIANDTACNDQNPCTVNDSCQDEICTGEAKDCSSWNTACRVGQCNTDNGACERISVADETPCEDGNLCTLGDTCLGGECVHEGVKDCATECKTGLCTPETGTCDGPAQPNGTSCDDSDNCTVNICSEGACTVTQNACECVGEPDGTFCSDGDRCTENDACLGEVCVGEPIICSGSEDGCLLGSCDQASGNCVSVPAQFGTACNDGNFCTVEDYCSAGHCIGAPKDCSVDGNACQAGTCNPANGNCDVVSMPNGLACESSDPCTSAATCQEGACTDLETATRCGVCEGIALGDACDDGNACTENDVCVLGAGGAKICMGYEKNCTQDSSACDLGACDPVDGTCKVYGVPLGGSCFDDNACTENDICTASGCEGTPYFVCGAQPDQCEIFEDISTSGTAMVIDDIGTGTVIRARIDEPGEADWFAMDLHAGDTIAVSTHGNCGTEIDTFVQFLNGAVLDAEGDESRAMIAYNDNDGESIWSRIDDIVIPENGKYYIQVQTHGGSLDRSYILAIDRDGPLFCAEQTDCPCDVFSCETVEAMGVCTPIHPTEVEPNDSMNTLNHLSVGDTRWARITNATDEDQYSVNLTLGVPVTIETLPVCDDSTNTMIKVRDPSGVLVAVAEGEGPARLLHFEPERNGRYEIQVNGQNGVTGPYLLYVGATDCTENESCQSVCENLSCEDGYCAPANAETESNDSLATAGMLLRNDQQYGGFNATNDRDFYFAWLTPGTYDFETLPFCGQGSDTILAAYRVRPDGNLNMLGSNDNGGIGLHSVISDLEVTGLTPAIIEVSAFGSSVGEYVLTANSEAEGAPTLAISEVLAGNDDLSFLAHALNETGLAETLAASGVYTLFAPNDAAFGALASTRGLGEVNDLLLEDDIVRILRHHIVVGAFHLPLLTSYYETETLVGEKPLLRPVGEAWQWADQSLAGDGDLALNGVVNYLATVVVPPPDPMASCDTANLDCHDNSTCNDETGQALCVCDAGYTGTYCEPVVCEADHFVAAHLCTPCAPGTTRLAGDLAYAEDTQCLPILCAENENVVNHNCEPCNPATPNEPGDDASGVDTLCDTPICAEDEYVLNHLCVACPAGTTNAPGDVISGDDTQCDITYCAANEYVIQHQCVPCEKHFVNDAGDDSAETGYSRTGTVGEMLYDATTVEVAPNGSVWAFNYYDNNFWTIGSDGTTSQIFTYFNYPDSLAFSADGLTVYIADSGSNRLFKMNTDGTNLIEFGFDFGWISDIEISEEGTVYIVDSGAELIRKIDAGSSTLTTFGADLLASPSEMALGPAGEIYVVDQQSGLVHISDDQSELEVIDANYRGYQLEIDAAGAVYMVSYEEDVRITRRNADGTIDEVLSGTYFEDMAVTADGQVYVTGYDIPGIERHTYGPINTSCEPKTHCLENEYVINGFCEGCPAGAVNVAGDEIASGDTECEINACGLNQYASDHGCLDCVIGSTNPPGDDSSAVVYMPSVHLESGLQYFTGLAVSDDGTVVVTEGSGGGVTRLSASGEASALEANLVEAHGVVMDVAGNVYVADPTEGRVKKIDGDGVVTESPIAFERPEDLALGPDGDLFVVDSTQAMVYKISPDNFGAALNDAGDAQYDYITVGYNYDYPISVAVTDNGVVYVGDSGSGKIVKCLPDAYGYYDGNIVTVAEELYDPRHIAVDKHGSVFVGDYSTVSKISAAGTTEVLVNDEYSSVQGLAMTSNGDVYYGSMVYAGWDAGNSMSVMKLTVSSADTACTDTLCFENFRVNNHICDLCEPGTQNEAGDNATGDDTECEPILCGADERVQDHACIACETGSDNVAGDDASGANTFCDPILCLENEKVSGNYCTPCPLGKVNVAGDNASLVDTECDTILCAENEHVVHHTCVPCSVGTQRASIDNASGVDTSCEPTFCEEGEYALDRACVPCEVGTESYGGADLSMTNYTYSTYFNGGLSAANGLAMDSTGAVYVSDSVAQTVRKIAADGLSAEVVISGFAGVAGIAIGPQDALYVADSGSGRIHKIDTVGETMVSQLMFVEPVDVDVGADGIVYVADKGASGIIWFDADGFQTPAANAQHDAGSGQGLGDGGWAGDEAGMHHDADGGMYHGDMFMENGDVFSSGYIGATMDPVAVSVTPQNVLYVSSGSANDTTRFLRDAYGYWNEDTEFSRSGYDVPAKLDTDAAGNLYLAEGFTTSTSDSQTVTSSNVIEACQWCGQEYMAVTLETGYLDSVDWMVSIRDHGWGGCGTYSYVALYHERLSDGVQTHLGTARPPCDGSDRTQYTNESRSWAEGPLSIESGDRLILVAISGFSGWEIWVNYGEITYQTSTQQVSTTVSKVSHAGYTDFVGAGDALMGDVLVGPSGNVYASVPSASEVQVWTAEPIDTSCTAIICQVDEYVVDNACTPCPPGTTNAEGGHEATGENTSCTATLCDEGYHVVENRCEVCPMGSTNDAGDNASGANTDCDPWICEEDEYVSGAVCVPCEAGSINEAGDPASGGDTTCDITLCQEGEYLLDNKCVTCPPGTTNNQLEDATGEDTFCNAGYCEMNERAENGSCVPCDGGTTSTGGVDPAATTFSATALGEFGLKEPTGLALGSDGSLYVTDAFLNAVKKIDPQQNVTDIGSGFSMPRGIALAADGSVYVADAGNALVKKVAPDGTITTVGDGFTSPEGVAIGPDGSLFIADSGAYTVTHIKPDGTSTQITYDEDGPCGLAVSPQGDLYVSYMSKPTIQKFVLSPWGYYSFEADLGFELSTVFDLQVDKYGNVFAAERWNYEIVKISQATMMTDRVYFSSNELTGLALSDDGSIHVATKAYEEMTNVGGISLLTPSYQNTTCDEPSTLTFSVTGNATVTSSPAGISCGLEGSDCTYTFSPGETVTLTYAAGPFAAVSEWTGDCAGSGDSCVVTMSGDRNAGVTFSEPTRPHPTIIAMTHIPVLHMMDSDGNEIGQHRVSGIDLSYWYGAVADAANNTVYLGGGNGMRGITKIQLPADYNTNGENNISAEQILDHQVQLPGSESNTTSHALALDPDAGELYWFINYSSTYGGYIQRCPVADCSHGNVEIVADLNVTSGFGSQGMGFYNGQLFFSTYNIQPTTYSSGLNVVSVGDGTTFPATPTKLYHFSDNEPEQVAVGSSRVYVVATGYEQVTQVVSMDHDGSNPVTIYEKQHADATDGSIDDLTSIRYIALDEPNGHLYVSAVNYAWPSGEQNRLYRMNTDGTGLTHIWSTMWTFSGVLIIP
ncbi:MAG: hypothetical protein CMH56_04975 [Myxococcales bacterium]|nr:hypothetical protein [Myxococcales bacterium]